MRFLLSLIILFLPFQVLGEETEDAEKIFIDLIHSQQHPLPQEEKLVLLAMTIAVPLQAITHQITKAYKDTLDECSVYAFSGQKNFEKQFKIHNENLIAINRLLADYRKGVSSLSDDNITKYEQDLNTLAQKRYKSLFSVPSPQNKKECEKEINDDSFSSSDLSRTKDMAASIKKDFSTWDTSRKCETEVDRVMGCIEPVNP